MYIAEASWAAAIVAASTDVLLGVLTLLGIAVGAFGAYWGIRRAKSGRIDTTEAADLWKEAGQMRTELRNEVAELNNQIKQLKEDNKALSDSNADYQRRLGELEREVERLRRDEDRLRARIQQLEKVHG